MKLLKEFATFEYEKVNTPVEPGCIMVKGILQRCNTLNNNGRIYPREILLNEIENYKKIIAEKRAFGECDHDDSAIVSMKNVSHMIEDIWVESDVVYGKVKVLDTPCGKIIQSILKAGGRPGISSRALGEVKEQYDGTLLVQDNLHLICWDFVSEPSTPGAFMFKESKEYTKTDLDKIFSKEYRVNRALNDLLSLNEIKNNGK